MSMVSEFCLCRYIGFRLTIENDRTLVFPFISHQNHPNIQVRAYFNILKKYGSPAFEREFGHEYLDLNEGCMGYYMNLSKVLDEKNGYLNDGALTVEYGFQVESEQGKDGIWMFNFFDLFYNWQSQDNMFWFAIEHGNHLFGHRQIVILHSKKISNSKKTRALAPKSITIARLIMCLQVTHGVRLQMTDIDYGNVARIASYFGFSNTARYCERQLIEMELTSNTEHVGMALKCNMRFYLVNYWYIKFRISIEDDGTWVYPFIFHDNHLEIQVRGYFNIIKKDGSCSFESDFGHLHLESDEGCSGEYMDIEELLDEENGYLDNGALTVEYGFQVDAEQGKDGIWMLNFFDLFFDWQSQDNTFCFTIEHGNHLFGHKQIIILHSKKVTGPNKTGVRVPKSITNAQLIMCLQITHGVRLQLTDKDYRNVARIAFHFGFSNTVRYCERQLIEMELTSNTEHVGMALKCNMRCHLVHQLKQIKTKKELINFLSRLNLENMSSESMKSIAAKIFSL
uniref:BTB domain-containing protein n=1 Tax=Caenorhabditis brenneri TaxID=135651 RepID=B6VBB4_CAEBE|nr:hypothetical protein Cbre_JD02.006 [Caenorhabditis brenneri]